MTEISGMWLGRPVDTAPDVVCTSFKCECGLGGGPLTGSGSISMLMRCFCGTLYEVVPEQPDGTERDA